MASKTKNQNVHHGHRMRMKNRFLNQGIDDFEMHEVLEVLLYYSLPRQDTNELAHLLLDQFGSISAVFDAEMAELCTVPGIGEKTATLLKLIPSLARVYMHDKTCSNMHAIRSAEEMMAYAETKFIGIQEERVYAVMLDNANRIVGETLLAKGGFDSVHLPTDVVVQAVIQRHAKNLFMMHNHPHGMALPSLNDKLLTQKLEEELRILNIHLLEHTIVGKGESDVVCLYAQGYLRRGGA